MNILLRSIVVLITILSSISAFAASVPGSPGTQPLVRGHPSEYTGPGDIPNISFTFFASVRGITRAYALPGTNEAVDLRRNDNAVCTALIGSSGWIDVSVGTPCNGGTQTVTDWNAAGATHTCTGSISGTTFTAQAATTCNIIPGDLLTGVGVAPGTYMTERGSCKAGQPFSGTCGVYPPQTVGVVTVTGTPYGMAPIKWYDQTGNNACGGGSCSLSSNGGTDWPLFFLSGSGCGNSSFPCLSIPDSSMRLISTNSFTPSGASHTSITVVAQIDDPNGSGLVTFMDPSESSTTGLRGNGVAETWSMAGSGEPAVSCSASNGAWHSANGVVGGPGTVCNVDGVEVSSGGGTPITLSGRPAIINGSSNGVMWIHEVAFANPAGWSTVTRAALCHNQRIAFGTPGSC